MRVIYFDAAAIFACDYTIFRAAFRHCIQSSCKNQDR